LCNRIFCCKLHALLFLCRSCSETSLLQDQKTVTKTTRTAPAIQKITTSSPTVKRIDFVLLERTLTDLQLQKLAERSVESSDLGPDAKKKRVTSDNVVQESNHNKTKSTLIPSVKSKNQEKERTFFDLKKDLSKSKVAIESLQRSRIGLRITNLRKGTPSVSLLFSPEECSSLQSSSSSHIKSSESSNVVSSVSSATTDSEQNKSENNTPPSVVSRRKCDDISKRKPSNADRTLTCSRAEKKDENWLSESDGKSSSISQIASSLQISSMKTKISRQMDTTSGIQSGSTTPVSAASSAWNIHRIVKKSEAENNRKRQMNEQRLNQLLRNLYQRNSMKLSTGNNPESANIICESDRQSSKSGCEEPGRNQKRPADSNLKENVKQLNVEENGKVLFCKSSKVLCMKVVSYQSGSSLNVSSGVACSEGVNGVDLKRLPVCSNTGRTNMWVNRHFWESSGVDGNKEKAPDDLDERLKNCKNSKDVGDAARKECRADEVKFVAKSHKGVGTTEDSLDEMLTNNDRSRGMLNKCSNKTEQNGIERCGSKVEQNEVKLNGNKNQVKNDTVEMSEQCQNQNIRFGASNEKETRSRSNAKRSEVIEEIRIVLSRNIYGCGEDRSVVPAASSEKNQEVVSLANEILSESANTVGPARKSCKFGEEEKQEVNGEDSHFLNGESGTGAQDALEVFGTRQNGDVLRNEHFLGVTRRIPERTCKKESIRMTLESQNVVRKCDSTVESSFKAKTSQSANKLPVRLKLPNMADFLVIGDFTKRSADRVEKTNSTVAPAKTNSNAKVTDCGVVTKKDENRSQKTNKNSFSAGRIESLRGNWNRKCDFKVEPNESKSKRKAETKQSEGVPMSVNGKLGCADSPQTEILVRESSGKNDDDNLDVNTFSRKTPEKTVDRNLGATTRMSQSSKFCDASSLVKSKMGKCLKLNENRRDCKMVITDAACDSSKVGSRSFDNVLAKQCGNVSDKKFSRVYKRLFGFERDGKRHTRSTKSCWVDEKENRRKKFNRNRSVGETSKDKKRNSKALGNTRSKRLGSKKQYKVNPSTPAQTEKCFKESRNVPGCKHTRVEFRKVMQDKTPDDRQKESKNAPKGTGDEVFNYSNDKRLDRVRKRERSLESKKEFVSERNVDNGKKPQTRSATAERSKTVDQTRNDMVMMLRKRKSVAPVPVLH
jgi:hypothetical protein